MVTPIRVEETTPSHGRHGENAAQAERRPRQPRSAPYDRARQRELVRQSLDLDLRTRAYRTDGEDW